MLGPFAFLVPLLAVLSDDDDGEVDLIERVQRSLAFHNWSIALRGLPFDEILELLAWVDARIASGELDEGTRQDFGRGLLEVAAERTHGYFTWPVAFSPDGKTLVTNSDDYNVRLVDVATGKVRAMLPHDDQVASVKFSPDGDTLATGSYDKKTRLINVATGNVRAQIKHDGDVLSVAFSPDGKTLATGSSYKKAPDNDLIGTVELIDVATGNVVKFDEMNDGDIFDTLRLVSFSPDGKTLAVASPPNKVKLIDVVTGEVRFTGEVRVKTAPDSIVAFVRFSPDGKILAASFYDSTTRFGGIQFIDVDTGKEWTWVMPGHYANSVAFSPDGKTLATGSDDRRVRFIDMATIKVRAEVMYDSDVKSVAFSPDGETLATGSGDDMLRLIDVATGKVRTEVKHGETVWFVVFSPDGETLATGSEDLKIRIFGRPRS